MALDTDLVATLRDARDRVVPFVGAGLVGEAGVPDATVAARALAERAANHGVDVPLGSFTDTCDAYARHFGAEALQRAVAEIVSSTTPRPTKALTAVVRCPRGSC